jgi:hypothetical protein
MHSSIVFRTDVTMCEKTQRSHSAMSQRGTKRVVQMPAIVMSITQRAGPAARRLYW